MGYGGRDVLMAWKAAGNLTEAEATEVDETLALLVDYVKLGAIPVALADEIIQQIADEKVRAWMERVGLLEVA